MSINDLFIDLQEAKAEILSLQNYIKHLEINNKEAFDEIQDLKKRLQKAKDFEKMAESAIESLSNGSVRL